MDENNSNRPKKPLAKKVMQFSGIAFVATGALALLGWMQSRDPDCALAEVDDTESYLSVSYLRMCDSYITNVEAASWWLFASGIFAIILGLVLIRLSNKK